MKRNKELKKTLKEMIPYLISLTAIGVAISCLLLSAYNHMLIQDLYRDVTELQDVAFQVGEALVKTNQALIQTTETMLEIWSILQDLISALAVGT